MAYMGVEVTVGKAGHLFHQCFALFLRNVFGKQHAVDEEPQFAVFKIAGGQITAVVVGNDIVTGVYQILNVAGDAFSFQFHMVIPF